MYNDFGYNKFSVETNTFMSGSFLFIYAYLYIDLRLKWTLFQYPILGSF